MDIIISDPEKTDDGPDRGPIAFVSNSGSLLYEKISAGIFMLAETLYKEL